MEEKKLLEKISVLHADQKCPGVVSQSCSAGCEDLPAATIQPQDTFSCSFPHSRLTGTGKPHLGKVAGPALATSAADFPSP